MATQGAVTCGLLRRDEEGRWWYADTQIGHDGQLYDGELARALAQADEAEQPGLEAWKPEPRQLSFQWPVEAPPTVDVGERTLAQAHAELWEQLDQGAFCDCCQRMARRYPRRLHREMARFLGKLVEAWEAMPERQKRYVALRDFWPHGPKASTDGSYLVHWDLVKRHPTRTGLYKPTPAGLSFVAGRIVVPKIAWVYAGRATHYSKETIAFVDALAEPVDVRGMLADRDGPEGR